VDFQDVDEIPEGQIIEPVRDPLLDITDPAVVKAKGRLKGALNKSRSTQAASQAPTQRDYRAERQRAYENTTRRMPSGFEYALADAVDLTGSQVQVPATQPSTSSQPPHEWGRGSGKRSMRIAKDQEVELH
jgi:hypothetical protein